MPDFRCRRRLCDGRRASGRDHLGCFFKEKRGWPADVEPRQMAGVYHPKRICNDGFRYEGPSLMNTRNVLEAYWSRNSPVPPVDLFAIAGKAGFCVIRDDALANGSSGQASYENGRRVIRVNPHEHEVRQRFTVAHELGHWFLGHLDGGGNGHVVFRDGPAQFSASVFRPKERAANQFAAELLIPLDTLDYFIMMQKGVADGYTLAVMFGVSTLAIDIRVKEWQRERSRALA